MAEKQTVFYKNMSRLGNMYRDKPSENNAHATVCIENQFQAHIYRGMNKWDYHKFFDAVYNVLLD